MLRDTFVQSLVSDIRLATQASRPVVTFLNGEYWGIYTLQERYDEYYLFNHYGVKPNEAVILRLNGVLYRGNPDDEKRYSSLLSFISKNPLSESQNYRYVQTQIDVDNYIDYLITEIYAGNNDWPHNNIYFWRMKTDQYEPDAPYGQDGRWRWMLFDMDWGFGLMGGVEDYKFNTLELAQNPEWSGFLLRSLLENDEFKIAFINRFADWMNTNFLPQRVISILDQTQAILRPEMNEFIQRWDPDTNSLKKWEEGVGDMRTFALKRPEAVRQQIIDQFGLEGTAVVNVSTDPSMGYVQINSIKINTDTPGIYAPGEWSGIYFKNTPITIKAIPNEGYKFVAWEKLEQTDPQFTINVTNDLTLKALFAPIGINTDD